MPEGFVKPINPSTFQLFNFVELLTPTPLTCTAFRKQAHKVHSSPVRFAPQGERELCCTPHTSRFTSKKAAFTLAEVLITLGIIGIVAAMTLPTLVQKKTNSEVEAKLKKIYSSMNQAIILSEIDNGPKEYWPFSCGDEDSNIDCETYYNKYILKYLKSVTHKEFESYGGYNIAIYFTDGTLLIGKAGYDYFFFPNAKNFDEDTFVTTSESGNLKAREGMGKTYFSFRFAPSLNPETDSRGSKFHYKKGFEPYKLGLSEVTPETTKTSCNKTSTANGYCTTLIQLNGWKIPDDYPFQVK